MDTTYDFPRSHQVETEGRTRHCYNNAAPGEGHIFRYDVSAVYENTHRADDATETEPASPASVQSLTTYSNLPSPAPVVNRGLKPGRKLSDSASVCSLVEPPSPRMAPSIDRKLKPSAPPRKSHEDEIGVRSSTHRAAPSPVPPNQTTFASEDDLDNNEQVNRLYLLNIKRIGLFHYSYILYLLTPSQISCHSNHMYSSSLF